MIFPDRRCADRLAAHGHEPFLEVLPVMKNSWVLNSGYSTEFLLFRTAERLQRAIAITAMTA